MDTQRLAATTITRARSQDAFAIGALHLRADREAGAGPDPGFLDRFADWWLPQRRQRPAWLARRRDGETVGVLAAVLVDARPRVGHPQTQWMHVSFVYVVPHARHEGIARRLVTACQTWSGANGITRVQLRATDVGRPLYAAQGFGPAASDLMEWCPTVGV